MGLSEQASPVGVRRSLRHPALVILVVSLFSTFMVAGCSGNHRVDASAAMPTMAPASVPTTAQAAPQNAMDMVPVDASAAWGARPGYVRSDSMVEEAYAYAMYHPQFVRFMPCYCGCGGMGHRSNLDCYFKKAIPGTATRFEEHASFCDICVKTTLLTKQLIGEGKSLSQIRQIVDQTFGGSTPGTPTELPPV